METSKGRRTACERALGAPEILEQILSHIANRDWKSFYPKIPSYALLPICLVSRDFALVAQKVLFRHVSISYNFAGDRPRQQVRVPALLSRAPLWCGSLASDLVQSLLLSDITVSEAAALLRGCHRVRELFFSPHVLERQKLEGDTIFPPTLRTLRLRTRRRMEVLEGIAPEALLGLANITVLEIDHSFECLQTLLENCGTNLVHLTLHRHPESHEARQPTVEDFHKLFTCAPKLRSIRLWAAVEADLWQALPSRIQHLQVDWLVIAPTDTLAGLLADPAWLPHLQQITIELVDFGEPEAFGPDANYIACLLEAESAMRLRAARDGRPFDEIAWEAVQGAVERADQYLLGSGPSGPGDFNGTDSE